MSQHALLSAGTKGWRSLACSRSELRLDLTLCCGQSFRWRETGDHHWTGVMGGRVWTLTQTDDTLWYHVYNRLSATVDGVEKKRRAGAPPCASIGSEKRSKGVMEVKEEEEPVPVGVSSSPDEKEEELLRDYFQLAVKLGDLYREWGAADPHFKHIANIFTGVRMLRQDPTECLFSFICTSNNHISRIHGMVERLCQSLGAPLCQLDQTSYHDFPSLSALADSSVEVRLRDLGFGYRAKFLQQSASHILDSHGGPQWLQELRTAPYLQAQKALRTLPGVGPKVADCVCLMSLDKASVVPVDTHVWQIAKRDYRCAIGAGQKSLTDKVHQEIGDFFRQLWGPYAGWAQSVLFCADLKKFQNLKETPSLEQKEVKLEPCRNHNLTQNTSLGGRTAQERRSQEEDGVIDRQTDEGPLKTIALKSRKMAPASVLTLIPTLILFSLNPSSGQEIVRTSSPVPDPVPITLQPTLPSSRPSGRGDVSVNVISRDWPTERGGGGGTSAPTRTRTTDLSGPVSPSQTLYSGSIQSQPTSVLTETGTMVTAEPSAVGSATGPKSFPPTKPSEVIPVTSEPEGQMEPEDVDDWQATGSGSELVATVLAVVKKESPVDLTTSGGMPQLRPEAQTAFGDGPSKMAEARIDPTVSLTVQPRQSVLTPAVRNLTTPSPNVTLTVVPVVSGVDTEGPIAGQNSTVTSPSPRSTTPGSTNQQPQSAAPRKPTAKMSTTTHGSTVTATSTELRGQTNPPRTATDPGSTASTSRQSTKTETTPAHTTPPLQVDRGRHFSINDSVPTQRNHSAPLGRPQLPPSSASSTPSLPPSSVLIHNGTYLIWNDLSRTLAFSWQLHVYGSASFFLLLMAGAALGLALSTGMRCPHRGALALANALLFLVGAGRAALFLVDPYGSRKVIPRPIVIALYNFPLPLLVWAQGALVLLAVKGAGLSLLPSALERPALAAVLAVLHCTLLMAVDLLSPALSPVVPLTLQCMSICWGLVLCMTYLGYIFPCLNRIPPQPPVQEEGRIVTALPEGRRTGSVLARVLAVCAVLGVLCCALHVYASLWLYGLLGDWTRFGWVWWLTHFWARLLELAWAFSLLLLSSWVFWRPGGRQGRGEGGAGESRAAGDLASPGQSSGSTNKHTCWAKIVQSLTGKTCGKSESNGVGGGGGGTGEVPNNWAGQERSGADISKSLIRNQNCEAPPSQTRSVKDSNRGRNQRGRLSERGALDDSAGSLLRMQMLGRPPQRSHSGSLERDKVSLYEFDLRPPSPIDLSRSIDEALHREHLLHGGSLFQPLCAPLPTPSPCSAGSQGGPWLRRNSDPQISDSSEESSMPLGGSVRSSVPSRQVTAPPTPSHQGHRWAEDGGVSVPSSVSCPVSLRHSRVSTCHLGEERGDETRPFFTPDSEAPRGKLGRDGAAREEIKTGESWSHDHTRIQKPLRKNWALFMRSKLK
ncbi:hypothetical protein DPEC_G00004170 [Dallia pectoralis]|uniref:Uncharacterized protein n=1 Tax=Dallia pectoralis TaxID=75939 RepID=A0ACC2HJY2_DALPE|nr:hypothetical protein DPEC_G00004170 [Dallia pectoralis]